MKRDLSRRLVANGMGRLAQISGNLAGIHDGLERRDRPAITHRHVNTQEPLPRRHPGPRHTQVGVGGMPG